MQKNIMIFGPTASGKTSLAIKLAKEHNGVIINADSRQMYKRMPILTAMPSEEEFSQAPHYLYNFLEPDEAFSVGDYLKLVKKTIAEIQAKDVNKTIVISGGTGMYLKVLLEGISPVPKVADKFVDALKARLKNEEIATLHAELSKVDKNLADKLAENDSQRIMRGLSVYQATGKPLSEFQKLPPCGGLDMDFHKIAINPDREELYARINARFDKMLEQGLIAEMQALKDASYNLENSGLTSLGVKELFSYLDGEISLDEVSQQIKQQTRRYAKRQTTWLRGSYQSDEVIAPFQ